MNRSFYLRLLLIASLTPAWLQAAGIHAELPQGQGAQPGPGKAHAAGQDPFQPLVSREESEWLNQAVERSQEDLSAARMQLQEQNSPEASPALDFAIGNFLFQEDRLPDAAKAYEQALKKMPHFRAAAMNLGRVYLLLDQPAKTVAVYQNLVRDGQADANILVLLGHAMLLLDEPVGAETAYRQAILLRPRDPEVRLGLAKALLSQERFKEGLALIRELQQLEPLSRELWQLRANALLTSDRLDEAIHVIEQARRLGRASAEQLATLGDLWLTKTRPVDALAAYQEAFAKEEASLDRVLRALEGFIMVADAQGAKEMMQEAEQRLKREPDPERALRLLRLRARHALQEEREEEAMNLAKQILEQDPLDAPMLLLLAELLAAKGNSAEALLQSERAARISGFEAQALILQARIEVGRGNYARAVPLLESAQVFDPQDPVARYLEQVRRLAE